MKKILIPTDFSSSAWNALKYALHLYEQEQCTFYILHTYSPIDYAMKINDGLETLDFETLQTQNDVLVKDFNQKLDDVIAKAKDEYTNSKHHFESLLSYNTLSDEINTQIERHVIELVIMGEKGVSNTKDLFFGSHTLHIMKTAKCPVLGIPESFHFKYIDDILFPTDFKHHYSKDDLSQVISLASLNEAIVHAFHISNEFMLSKEQEDIKKEIHTYFKNIKHNFKDVPEEEVSSAIQEYATSHNIGLVAMTRRKHSFLERILFKEHIKVLGLKLKIPFLVIPVN